MRDATTEIGQRPTGNKRNGPIKRRDGGGMLMSVCKCITAAHMECGDRVVVKVEGLVHIGGRTFILSDHFASYRSFKIRLDQCGISANRLREVGNCELRFA